MDITQQKPLFSLSAKKCVGRYREFGCSMYGATKFGASPVKVSLIDGSELEVSGVYQKRHSAGRSIFVRERFYFPANPNTPAQLQTRQNIRSAVASWQELTDEQKAVYNERAKGLSMSGYNLYIRDYIKSL